MARLALLIGEPKVVVRVKSALSEHHELHEASNWDDLVATLESATADGCIIDLFHPTIDITHDHLAELRERSPFSAIVIYSDFDGRETELFDLGVLGVNEVILAGREDGARDISRAISSAFTSSVANRVTNGLEERVHPVALRAIQWAIAHAGDEAPPTSALARALGYDLLQLQRLLRSEGLPTPSGFLIWGRVFAAINLVLTTRKTREDVAFSVGYVSMAGLNRAFKTVAGHTVEQVLKRGGVAFLIERFLDQYGRDDPSSSDS